MDETAQGGAPAAQAEPKEPADSVGRARQPGTEAEAPLAVTRLPDSGVPPPMGAVDASFHAEPPEAIAAPRPSAWASSPPAPEPTEAAPTAPALPAANETQPDLAAADSPTAEPEPVAHSGAVPAAGPGTTMVAAEEGSDACAPVERIEAVEHFQEYCEAPSVAQRGSEAAHIAEDRRAAGPAPEVATAHALLGVAAETPEDVAAVQEIGVQDDAAVVRPADAVEDGGRPAQDAGARPDLVVSPVIEAGHGTERSVPSPVVGEVQAESQASHGPAIAGPSPQGGGGTLRGSWEGSRDLAIDSEAERWKVPVAPDRDRQAGAVSAEAGPAATVAGPAPVWAAPSWAYAAGGRPTPSDMARDALPYVRRVLWGAGVVAAGLVVAVLVLAVAYRWINPPISTLMLGQSLAGTPIERTWVPIERISPNLIRAVVLSEDAGFCRHGGVDWAAIEEAIEGDRGGSTITMQVVKNLFLWPSRSYVRKVIEIGLAYLVESLWPKRRIMEIYLNIAEWGDGVFGAEAAARAHFDKRASRLTAQEAALLAVALPNPIDRTPAAPSLGTGRLASRLMQRMTTSRVDLSCLPVPRTPPRKAPLVPGPRLTL